MGRCDGTRAASLTPEVKMAGLSLSSMLSSSSFVVFLPAENQKWIIFVLLRCICPVHCASFWPGFVESLFEFDSNSCWPHVLPPRPAYCASVFMFPSRTDLLQTHSQLYWYHYTVHADWAPPALQVTFSNFRFLPLRLKIYHYVAHS